MWHEELASDKSWASLWSGYFICGTCSGIRPITGACPICGDAPVRSEMQTFRLADGRDVQVPVSIVPGAEGRYEDWIYLNMLKREWNRPVAASDRLAHPSSAEEPSPRAAIVVLFWSYFETRAERLVRAGMRDVPPRLTEDILQRYSSIGSRLDRLYRLLFETTYWADLTDLGYDDTRRNLLQVQDRRNAFAHGEPSAINDALVALVIDNLKREHEAWIAVFNRRIARSLGPNS